MKQSSVVMVVLLSKWTNTPGANATRRNYFLGLSRDIERGAGPSDTARLPVSRWRRSPVILHPTALSVSGGNARRVFQKSAHPQRPSCQPCPMDTDTDPIQAGLNAAPVDDPERVRSNPVRGSGGSQFATLIAPSHSIGNGGGLPPGVNGQDGVGVGPAFVRGPENIKP